MRRWSKRFSRDVHYDLCLGGIFTALAVLLVVLSVQHGLMLLGSDSSAIQTFEGTCTVSTKRYHRNTVYLFNLENGDTVLVQPDDVLTEDTLSETSAKKHLFQYSAFRRVFPIGTHMPLSISTVDGKTMLLDVVAIQSDYTFLCVFWAILAIVFLVPVFFIVWFRMVTRKRKHH